jgi:anti-anti-sigma regulatory factor
MAVPHEQATAHAGFDLEIVEATGDRVSIRAAGDLDDRARERLSVLLDAELGAGHVFVRMDLSAVRLVGGSCLDTLKDAHDDLLASDGLLLLEGLCEEARQVLVRAGLDRCLFLSGAAGPPDWLPNLPGLADLVRHECEASPVQSGPDD